MSEDIKEMTLPTSQVVTQLGTNNALCDPASHQRLTNLAQTFAKSQFVPQAYRNPADCYVAIHMAMQMGIDPIFYMQNTQPVLGNITWKSPAVIAMINSSGKYKGEIDWEIEQDAQGIKSCVAFIQNKQGRIIKGTYITREMVKAEGWLDKSGSKWKTMSEQMFKYRAVTFFARLYCPEILMGLYTRDEYSDKFEYSESKKEKQNYDSVGTIEQEPERKQTDIEDLLI